MKVYPGGTRAVDGIDFVISQGEFLGFLGPNGAGKSTTIKILSTLLKKTSGRVIVGGHDVDRDPNAVRASIGIAMQEVGLDDLSTGRDFMMLQGLLYGLRHRTAERRAAELLDLVGLTSVADRRVGTYSGGMRRRIDLVSALMHDPSIIFLDEPTTGLDPQSRFAIWDYLTELNQRGVTILLTTQMMAEADRLCERIAIVDYGRIVAGGSPEELKAEVGGDLINLSIESGNQVLDGALKKAEALLRDHSYEVSLNGSTSSLTVRVTNGGATAPELMRLLHDRQIPVASLSVASPSLDDVFLMHTGRTIR